MDEEDREDYAPAFDGRNFDTEMHSSETDVKGEEEDDSIIVLDDDSPTDSPVYHQEEMQHLTCSQNFQSTDDEKNRLVSRLRNFTDHENLRFQHPGLRGMPVDPNVQGHSFRQLVTVRGAIEFSQQPSAGKDLWLNYGCPSPIGYHDYSAYMDNPLSQGGLQNHLEIISGRLRDISDDQRGSWIPSSRIEPFVLDADRVMEENQIGMEEFQRKHEPMLRDAYERYAAFKEPKPPAAKKPPGVKTYKAPARAPKPATTIDEYFSRIPAEPTDPPLPSVAVQSSAYTRNPPQESKMPKKPSNDKITSAAVPESLPQALRQPVIGTAKDKMKADIVKGGEAKAIADTYGLSDKTLGPSRKPSEKFLKPITGGANLSRFPEEHGVGAGLDKHLVDIILGDVLELPSNLKLDDVVGQTSAKEAIEEAVVLPTLNPEFFVGLISPVRGVLLYGPPGNGKTMLARAVASSCKQTFFNVSASTLASKFIGEGEKLVRTLFELARQKQPSIIFVDEIDSILTSRKENEHDATRKMKTEFLVQFDGVASKEEDRVLVIAATNLPQELDTAALRRFPKRIMVPLPDKETRKAMLERLLEKETKDINEKDYEDIVKLTEGYSGSDITALAKEAAMQRIRSIGREKLATIKREDIRPINAQDFRAASQKVRASTPKHTLETLDKWSRDYGHT